MRQLVEKLQQEIVAFVEQREALFLLVEARQEDAPLVAKLVSEIEKSNQTDIFLVLLAEFVTVEQYVAAAVEQLVTQHQAVCAELGGQALPPLPPLPADLGGRAWPPSERLQAVIRAARALLPSDGGHRLVYVLWPMAVAAPAQFTELIRSLLPTAALPDWSHGTRLIVRELPGTPHELAAAVPRRRFKRLRSDFSPPALKASMESVAADPGQSLAERMQALLMLATLDHAEGRPAAAIEKYEWLLAYYQETKNPTMEALVLNHIGEVYHRERQFERARRYYESALVPVEQSPVPLLLLLLARNLGDLAFLDARYADARECYIQWQLVAERLEDIQSQVIALQKLGLCQEQLGESDAAVCSYEAAAELCSKWDVPGMDREHLGPLQKLYERRGQFIKAQAVAEALAPRPESAP